MHTFESGIHFSLLVSSLLQLFDSDEDERITREEFTALLRSALGVSDLNMAKLFKEIDADGSGFITFSEWTLPEGGLLQGYVFSLLLFFQCILMLLSFLVSDEFQAFATTHPEYAKLFTTYLELQRYQAIQEATPGDLELAGESRSGDKQEDSTSDKKDD